jgi:hypothetical protein
MIYMAKVIKDKGSRRVEVMPDMFIGRREELEVLEKMLDDAVKDLIETAKEEYEKNAYDRAFEFADKALNTLETGQSAKARGQLGHALEMFERLGMKKWMGYAKEKLSELV